MTELQKVIKALEIINGKVQELSQKEDISTKGEPAKTVIKRVEESQDNKPTISFKSNSVVTETLDELYQRHKVMADGKFLKGDFLEKVMILGIKELGIDIKV